MGRGGYDLTPTTTTPPPHTHNLSGIMGKQILDTQTREPLGILDIYTEHDGKINQRLDVCFQECTHTFRPAKSGPQERDHSSVVSERNQYCFLLCLIVPCLSYICLGIHGKAYTKRKVLCLCYLYSVEHISTGTHNSLQWCLLIAKKITRFLNYDCH